jgi:predicted metal-dependent hydrolase
MKKVSITGLGTVTFIKRRNNRRINVKIEPHDSIKVSLPHHIPFNTAIKFVQENTSIIQNKAATINNRLTIFYPSTQFKTMWHDLRLIPDHTYSPYFIIENHSIIIKYPGNQSVEKPEIQQTIRNAIEETLRKEAKIYLPRRLNELAIKYKLNYNKVFVKNIKTLWGSCSQKNNINLNIHLMRLPKHLIDYIILHELAHTVIKNHGPSFHNLLTSMLKNGSIDELKNELQRYTPQIY